MTISIRLDPKTETALRLRLRKREVPLSAFVREAICEKLKREEEEGSPFAIGEPLFGRYSSGETDRSTRRKQIVLERLGERSRR